MAYRDYSVWREEDGWWYQLTAAGIIIIGAVLLSRLHDLRQWEYLHLLVENATETTPVWTGMMQAPPRSVEGILSSTILIPPLSWFSAMINAQNRQNAKHYLVVHRASICESGTHVPQESGGHKCTIPQSCNEEL